MNAMQIELQTSLCWRKVLKGILCFDIRTGQETKHGCPVGIPTIACLFLKVRQGHIRLHMTIREFCVSLFLLDFTYKILSLLPLQNACITREVIKLQFRSS